MSRTRKSKRTSYNKENKPARKRTNRVARHNAKKALENESYDSQALTFSPTTSGWETH